MSMVPGTNDAPGLFSATNATPARQARRGAARPRQESALPRLHVQAALGRLRHGLGASARAQLPEQRFDVELDGVGREVERARDRLVGQPLADRAQHFDLARGEKRAELRFLHRREAGWIFAPRVVHQDVRLLRRVDDVMAGLGDDPAQLGEQRGIFRADRYAQAPCREPLRGHGAHAAGRASTMACSERTVPPRITRSSALRPMLSEARCVAILRRLRVGVPLTVRTMSPATMPALAAGPPSTMDITITPLDWPAWPCSASGTATGCSATPSQPRAMCPSLSSAGTTRSMVAEGMTSTLARGPNVVMPSRPPAASSTGPPSSARARRRSSTIWRSMRPPALLAHSGPARLTTPRRTLTPPAPSAPKASASAPAFTSPLISVGASTALVSRRTAMLVPGSRPASFAFTADPPATISSNSSRFGSDCSEATTTSGCQSVPVRCRVSESRMAATAPRAAAACAASASENCSRLAGIMDAE